MYAVSGMMNPQSSRCYDELPLYTLRCSVLASAKICVVFADVLSELNGYEEVQTSASEVVASFVLDPTRVSCVQENCLYPGRENLLNEHVRQLTVSMVLHAGRLVK